MYLHNVNTPRLLSSDMTTISRVPHFSPLLRELGLLTRCPHSHFGNSQNFLANLLPFLHPTYIARNFSYNECINSL